MDPDILTETTDTQDLTAISGDVIPHIEEPGTGNREGKETFPNKFLFHYKIYSYIHETHMAGFMLFFHVHFLLCMRNYNLFSPQLPWTH